MKTKTDFLLAVMNVLAWIAFLGLCIKAGSILISYGVSISNPVASKDLYMGLNLSAVRDYDFGHYTGSVLLMAFILIMEAYTAFLVTRALSKIKMANPFTSEVSKKLVKISYIILFTWVAALLYNGHSSWLSKRIPGFQENLFSTDFIFLAGVVFVFAQIFRKGVEIQSENELTV
ncbi:MAG: DUF2975 domain-containing protein [Chitinophagales bacterium]